VFGLSRWNVVVKQQVDLANASILSFWKSEPTPLVAEEIDSGVEESSLYAPVPG